MSRHPPFLFLLLLLLPLLRAPARAQSDTACDNLPPSVRVCRFSATLTAQSDCSLLVDETIILRPSNSNSSSSSTSLIRSIPALSATPQRVSQLRHFRDAVPSRVVFLPTSCASDQILLNLSTSSTSSSNPLVHRLVYRLSHGLTAFSQRCSSPDDEDQELSNGVVRWRSGTWSQPIGQVLVTYESKDKTLRIAGLSDNKTDRIIYDSNTLFDDNDDEKVFGVANRDVYFVELGANPRCKNISCFNDDDQQPPSGGGVSAGAVIGIVALVVAVLVVAFFIVRAVGRARERRGGGRGGGSVGGGGGGGIIYAEEDVLDSGAAGGNGRGRRQRRQQQQQNDGEHPFDI